jgi:phage gpG-like protein
VFDVQAEVRGLKEVQRKNEQMVRDLHGIPMLNTMRRATLMVQRDAKLGCPVVTGRLRNSITPEVRAEGKDVQGVVGSNVEYAPKVEQRRQFFLSAFEQNSEAIVALVGDTVSVIVRK